MNRLQILLQFSYLFCLFIYSSVFEASPISTSTDATLLDQPWDQPTEELPQIDLESELSANIEEAPAVDISADLLAQVLNAMNGKTDQGQSTTVLGNQDKDAKWRDAYEVPITYKLVKAIPFEELPATLRDKFKSERHFQRSLREIINRAFKIWADSGNFRFTEVSKDDDAEIKIMFVPSDHRNIRGSRPINGIPENTLGSKA